MLKSHKGICWTSDNRVNTGGEILRPAKWSRRSSMEIIKKCSYHFFVEFIRRKAIVIWWQILYNLKKFWSVICVFSDSYLDVYSENLGGVSDEQRKRFQQNISNMEKPYQSKWIPCMLADYWWTRRRDVSQTKCSGTWSSVTFYVTYELSVISCKYKFSSNFKRGSVNKIFC